jgi:enoyl-CoA hydratase/carnithine racemase
VNAGLVVSAPGRIWRLTLNRPEARNAVSGAMLDQLSSALAGSAADPECRVVILNGAGKDFCAGADMAELMAARDGADPTGYARTFEQAMGEIEGHPRPVIAAVHGAALGAGCQIAVACDLVMAAEDARFGIPSAKLGIVINHENVQRLVAAIGPKRAGAMLLAGRTISGVEAVEWGLATEAVTPEALEPAVDELAERVAELAPLSVAASKRGIRSVLGRLSPGSDEEFETMAARALSSHDLLEGLTAFRERRPPEFRGR